jgi:hypothetical protein
MANSITKFKKYIDKLDEVYKMASLTADLESDATLVKDGSNTNEIVIPKMTMDGLADYSRNTGYVTGSVTLTYETVTFNYDRGRKFNIDAMDNEETAGVAFGKLASEFVRTKTTPEQDAFRFAKYAQTSSIGTAEAEITDASALMTAIITAETAMDEAEVLPENRFLYITPTKKNLILALDTTKSKEVLEDFAKVVAVPQSRFYTKIKLLSGGNGEEAGHYTKASDGKDINFMIIQKDAVMQYTKHKVSKIITPEINQTDLDGYIFFFRAYGLTDVYENRVKGIYVHTKPVTSL